MKELDKSGLQFVKVNAQKKIDKLEQSERINQKVQKTK